MVIWESLRFIDKFINFMVILYLEFFVFLAVNVLMSLEINYLSSLMTKSINIFVFVFVVFVFPSRLKALYLGGFRDEILENFGKTFIQLQPCRK